MLDQETDNKSNVIRYKIRLEYFSAPHIKHKYSKHKTSEKHNHEGNPNLYGWQKQENNSEKYKYKLKTVQGLLEDALNIILKTPIKTYGASRTDAGVHAHSQICHFDYQEKLDLKILQRSLNAFLNRENINIYSIEEASSNFHARFSPKTKTYTYLIWNSQHQNIFYQHLSWHVRDSIDIVKLKYNIQMLEGQHDFKSFQDSQCQSKTSVKHIEKVSLEIINNQNQNLLNSPLPGHFIKLTFLGRSFLHHQIRNMVGTLIQIATNRIDKNTKEILELKDRKKAGITAPAHGLHLSQIIY